MSDTNQRYQRLGSAVYLVTSFFADQEPLKWRLRSLSADLICDGLKDKRGLANEMTALFGLAKNAGLVSDVNYGIIASELSKVQNIETESVKSLLASNNHFPSENVQKIEEPAVSNIAPENPKKEVVQDVLVKDETKVSVPKPSEEKVETNYLSLPKNTELKPSLKEFGAVSVKKNSRQSTIIALLKRKKEIMIKDVSPLISGCSEKTIQRELSDMVETGVLKKFGEKRWTRYTLA